MLHKQPTTALLLLMVIGWAFSMPMAAAQARADANSSQIAGTWRGNSVCVVKDSPCHDEINVYRFSKISGRVESFSVTASKVVDGKEVVMGTSEWTYDFEKHVLECKLPSVRLVLDGDKMEGALKLADGTVYRRIYLKRDN